MKFKIVEFTFDQLGLKQAFTKNLSSTLDERMSQNYDNNYHKFMSNALRHYEKTLVPSLTELCKTYFHNFDEIEICKYYRMTGVIAIEVTFKDKLPHNLTKKMKEIVEKYKLNEIY